MQSYRFSNLLGATYKGGSVQFTPDGNTLLSPVGNRVNCVDLVQGRCSTLKPETVEDIRVFDLSPDGRLLLCVDLAGRGMLVNFVRGSVLQRIGFKAVVHAAKWSPDSNWLAVAAGRHLVLWRAPSIRVGWQFMQHRKLGGHQDDLLDVSWAPNSRFLVTCSKDMTVRIWSTVAEDGFEPISLVEHRSMVRGAFFSADIRHIYSLSRDGVLVTLRYDETPAKPEKEAEPQEGDPPKTAATAQDLARRPLYCRPGTWTVAGKAYCTSTHKQKVTRCAYDAGSRLFAAGFSGGIFMLFEMPEMQALQTLSLGSHALDSVALGANGDWLAVGSAEVGQLLVWEWRSETYVLKQQGHHWGIQCVAFSPAAGSSLKHQRSLANVEARPEDKGSMMGGRLVATGGYDGKVKLFNSQTGLCFVTFAEHTAPISALCFTPQGNAVLSASKDGSVRAFDLLRYRNFRTFVSPDGLCQFSGIAVDSGGEIVAASTSSGSYAIYVWSIQTGNVLEVLTAHESYVQSLQFSPSASHPGQLISGGWDGKVCVWDLYATKGGSAEPLRCPGSVLSVAFDPRANDVCAASCMSGQVLFWNTSTAQHLGSIEGLRDIQSARQWHDVFAASHSKGKRGGGRDTFKHGPDTVNLNQHFNSIAYARSGELLVCSSKNSPMCCLYDTTSYMLAAKVTLTTNRSLSGTKMILFGRDVTEDGVQLKLLDLSDEEADDEELARAQQRKRQATSLPGVSVGEAKDMYSERELHVWGVAFSADSQQFAAATTHGVFVFSADLGLGTPSSAASLFGGEISRFAPQMLTKNVSAPAVLQALSAGDLSRAMILALALNDYGLLRKVYQSVPRASIPLVISSIGSPLLPALIWFLGAELKPVTGTPHFQFHVHWVLALIDLHFQTLLEMSAGKTTERTGTMLEAAAASRSDVVALCLGLLVELSQRHSTMAKTFESNRYLLRYLGSMPIKEEAEAAAAAAKEAAASRINPARIEAAAQEARHRREQASSAKAAKSEEADGAAAAEDAEAAIPAGSKPLRKRRRSAAATAAEATETAEEAELAEAAEAAEEPAEAPGKKKKKKRRRQTGTSAASVEDE
uniref:Small-subunit processome Utp12 domain-containing protein n=1 Tax=Alexandrium monilatum TaxID=311494 RepID=A0A7S4VDS4_9DINO